MGAPSCFGLTLLALGAGLSFALQPNGNARNPQALPLHRDAANVNTHRGVANKAATSSRGPSQPVTSQTCHELESMVFKPGHVIFSNLGGAGPDKGYEPTILFKDVLTGRKDILLEISNTSEYRPGIGSANGLQTCFAERECVADIGVAPGTAVNLKFRFLDGRTSGPVAVGPFHFSVLSLAQGHGDVQLPLFASYTMTNDTKVSVKPEGGFHSNASARQGPRLFSAPSLLAHEHGQDSVSFLMPAVSTFEVTYLAHGNAAQSRLAFAGRTSLACPAAPAVHPKALQPNPKARQSEVLQLQPRSGAVVQPEKEMPAAITLRRRPITPPADLVERPHDHLAFKGLAKNAGKTRQDGDMCRLSVLLDISSENMVFNNLGGLGPDVGVPHGIRYGNVFPWSSKVVDLEIVNTSFYAVQSSHHDNKVYHHIGSVGLQAGHDAETDVHLKFTFFRHGTSVPEHVPPFFFSFLQLRGLSYARIAKFQDVFLAEGTHVKELPDKHFVSNGTNRSPLHSTHPLKLGLDEQKDAVSFALPTTSSFWVTFAVRPDQNSILRFGGATPLTCLEKHPSKVAEITSPPTEDENSDSENFTADVDGEADVAPALNESSENSTADATGETTVAPAEDERPEDSSADIDGEADAAPAVNESAENSTADVNGETTVAPAEDQRFENSVADVDGEADAAQAANESSENFTADVDGETTVAPAEDKRPEQSSADVDGEADAAPPDDETADNTTADFGSEADAAPAGVESFENSTTDAAIADGSEPVGSPADAPPEDEGLQYTTTPMWTTAWGTVDAPADAPLGSQGLQNSTADTTTTTKEADDVRPVHTPVDAPPEHGSQHDSSTATTTTTASTTTTIKDAASLTDAPPEDDGEIQQITTTDKATGSGSLEPSSTDIPAKEPVRPAMSPFDSTSTIAPVTPVAQSSMWPVMSTFGGSSTIVPTTPLAWSSTWSTTTTTTSRFGLCQDLEKALVFSLAGLNHSNLGGWGPDLDAPKNLLFLNVFPHSKATVDLVVANLTEYTPFNAALNGLSGMRANINMMSGTETRFRFKFLKRESRELVSVGPFYLTLSHFMGLRGHWEPASVMISHFLDHHLDPETNMKFDEVHGLFTGPSTGEDFRYPKDPMQMTAAQRKNAIMVKMSPTAELEFVFRLPEDGPERNFAIAGRSNVLCKDLSTTVQAQATTTAALLQPNFEDVVKGGSAESDVFAARAVSPPKARVLEEEVAVPSLADSSACGERESLQFSNASVIHSNLGGAGPDVDSPPTLLISDVFPGSGVKINLEVSNVTEYIPSNATKNGVGGDAGDSMGELGRHLSISLLPNSSTTFSLRFMDAATSAPVGLAGFYLSALQVVNTSDGLNSPTIEVPNCEGFRLHETSMIVVRDEKPCVFNTVGSGLDGEDVGDSLLLSREDQANAVSILLPPEPEQFLRLAVGEGSMGHDFILAGQTPFACPYRAVKYASVRRNATKLTSSV